MMKTSRSSSLFAERGRLYAAVAGIVLAPQGPVAELVKKENPWHGFSQDGAVLTVLRAQKLPVGSGQASCEAWSAALEADAPGRSMGNGTRPEWDESTQAWMPWREDDAKAVLECESAPCDVKLNGEEAGQMGSVEPGSRMSKYQAVVFERVVRYLKTQERKEYEFKGDPVDPWKVFDSIGLKSPQKLPPKPQLRIRRMDLSPGKIREIRQVLDRRVAFSTDRRQATVWTRDVYTDHYFDGWGEWADLRCDVEPGQALLVQGALLELDLMKKDDVLSKMMRGKMRAAMEENGKAYLNRWFARVRRRASETRGTAPGPHRGTVPPATE